MFAPPFGEGAVGVRAPLHEPELPVVPPYRLVDGIDAPLAAVLEAGAVIINPAGTPWLLHDRHLSPGVNHHGHWQL